MSQDVKESLTAWISVLLLAALLILVSRVVDRFPPPRWLVDGFQGLNLLTILFLLSRWFWRRRRLRRASGGAD